MAFFKFRNKSDAPVAAPVQPESIERLRQRAKYRLVGASVLVLLGVVGFPLLFDQQPRPIAVDTPIQIPDKNKVQPLALPVPAPAVSEVVAALPASAAVAAASTPAPAVITEPAEVPKSLPNAEKNVPSAPVQKASAAAKSIASDGVAEKTPASTVVKGVAKQDSADKALALLEAQSLPKPSSPASADAGAARFVVQVGAFADTVRAKDVRRKLEAAGLKTYTNVAQTKDGERTRVRVGPFVERADADKAAEKIKKLKLPAVVLTL